MCKSLSTCYLVLLNTVFALCGLAVTGASAYFLIEYNEIDVIFSKKSLWVILGCGVAVALLSFFGCLAAKRQNKCMLVIYITSLIILVAAQAIAGAVVLKYTDTLHTDNGSIVHLSDDVQEFVNCTWEVCCAKQSSTCEDNLWNAGKLCKILPSDLAPSGSCDYTEDGYNTAVVDWLKKNQRHAAVAVLVIAGAEIFAVIFAIVLLCTSKKNKYGYHEQETSQTTVLIYKDQQPPVYGGSIAYGSPQKL